VGSKFVIWGGCSNNTGTGTFYNTGSAYDPSANSWTAVDTTDADLPTVRSRHSAAATSDGKMAIWGGWDGTNNRNYAINTGAVWDPANGSDPWAPLGPARRRPGATTTPPYGPART